MMRTSFVKTLIFLVTLSSSCTSGNRSASLSEEGDTATTEALTATRSSIIAPHARQDLCLTALDGNQVNGSQITLAPCTSIKTQLFAITSNSTLRTQDKMCLDVADGKNENGARVQLWACASNNTNQLWKANEEGVWTWVGKNKCLDVVDGNFGADAKLQIWDCDKKNKNQLWRQLSPVRKGLSDESGKILAETNVFNTQALNESESSPLRPGNDLSIGSLYRAGLCLDVHDIETKPFVQMYLCNDQRSQRFKFTSNGQIQFPNQDVTTEVKSIIATNSLCLSLEDLPDDQGSTPTLAVCDDSRADQKWATLGETLINLKSSTCLGLDVLAIGSWSVTNIPMQKCTQSPVLRLTIGSKKEIDDTIVNAASQQDVDAVSKPWVQLIDRTGDSDGMKTFLQQFGGPDALTRWIADQFMRNNKVAYSEASQVPNVSIVKLVFEYYPGMGTTERPSGNTSVANIRLNYAFYKTQTKQEVLRTLAHELAHASQYLYGVPAGFIEGYANWIRAKAFDSVGNRSPGGSWKDGYDRTQYFLEWLDRKFPSSQGSALFTLRMNLKSRSSEMAREDKWFDAWFRGETGQNVDTMWTLYQKEF